jgi:hypothetical protein
MRGGGGPLDFAYMHTRQLPAVEGAPAAVCCGRPWDTKLPSFAARPVPVRSAAALAGRHRPSLPYDHVLHYARCTVLPPASPPTCSTPAPRTTISLRVLFAPPLPPSRSLLALMNRQPPLHPFSSLLSPSQNCAPAPPAPPSLPTPPHYKRLSTCYPHQSLASQLLCDPHRTPRKLPAHSCLCQLTTPTAPPRGSWGLLLPSSQGLSLAESCEPHTPTQKPG